ncbi:MAG: hypothetical protein ABIH25_00450 [Candidatus Woesearchaeota archaeon]
MKEENKLDKDIKKLVLYRLDATIPLHFKLSIGNKGVFTKEELKGHIEKEDEIGRIFVDMQLEFIKASSSGKISEILAK